MRLLVLLLSVGVACSHVVKRSPQDSALDALIDSALGTDDDTADVAVEPVGVGPTEPGAGPPEAGPVDAEGVEQRVGYQWPRPPPLPTCGIEYDCIEDCHCNEFNEIEVDISGQCGIDLRSKGSNATLLSRTNGVYAGANSFIPQTDCNLPGAAYPGTTCCRKPMEDKCPPGEYCVRGWHCPNHDGSQWFDLRQVPRSCGKYGNDPGVCCNVRSTFGPVPKTCGVRNPDGVKPIIPLEAYEALNLRQGYGNTQAKIETQFAEFPWQALIYIRTPNGYQFKAGGVLISNRHVLTVAHHVYGVDSYDLQVRLGEYQVNTLNEPIEHQDYYVNAHYIHPDYHPKKQYNDIAVLELSDPVYIFNNVHVACLPADPYATFDEKQCVATGWGKHTFEGNFQNFLNKIDLPMVPHHKCEAALKTTRLSKYFRLHDSFICAGGEPGRDTCTGDGGGPLVCQVEGHYVVAGLTAWGIGCAQGGIPGVYASVANALPWIESVLAQGPQHKMYPRYIDDVAPGFRVNDDNPYGTEAQAAAGSSFDTTAKQAQGQASAPQPPKDESQLTSADLAAALQG